MNTANRPFINDIDATAIELDSSTPADSCIIWLHGLGADGSDFVSLVPELHLPPTLPTRFIFPHAPFRPITFNPGYEMRAWFDIIALSHHAPIDEAGILASKAIITSIIEREEARGIRSDRIILAGFSQGAVIALATGLSYAKPLAGLLMLSGYLPIAEQILGASHPANRHTPIFVAHGTQDTILSYALGKRVYVTLKQAGYAVSWHNYEMAHSLCTAEIHDISQWIQYLFRVEQTLIDNKGETH
jgi:phospholipase/carboxylesterase